MKWTQYDKNQVTNLVIALKKAKFELTGMEVVAFADVFRWVNSLHEYIEKSLEPAPIVANPVVPLSSEPQPPVEQKKKKK